MRLRAGWQIVAKLMNSVSSARVQEAVVDAGEKELGIVPDTPGTRIMIALCCRYIKTHDLIDLQCSFVDLIWCVY